MGNESIRTGCGNLFSNLNAGSVIWQLEYSIHKIRRKMDWFLSITTLLVNSGLGWTKGKPWMWILHSINAFVWIVYALIIKQYGLVLLSVVTIIVDIASAWKSSKAK